MKTSSFLVFVLMSLAFSCKKKNPEPECGCDGKPFKQVANLEATYHGHGNFTIYDTSDSTSARTGAVACEVDSTWQKAENYKVRNYIISGDLKSTCYSGESLVAIPPYITITSITKK
ncbi:hypothetical protein [Dyadobacter luticola]|uniref:Uncharacterized protein n=1 Tax=Dyadobacter luticola TaxID=1979387 RepID=A0A5R9L323_9BACT|nr:hypothetical protein [Dyadobacter luticola]TLV02943.1 hypothetical protein FEN17_04845 [Dyadobacter luticola]